MGMGKTKREMTKIEDKQALQVTFSKRKKGLFKKAEQLSVLTGAPVFVIVFSPAGRPFVFGDEGLIRLYLQRERNIPEAVEDEDHLSLGNINLEYSRELQLFLADESNATKPASEQQQMADGGRRAVIDKVEATQQPLHDDALMETEVEGNASSRISPSSEDVFSDLPPLDLGFFKFCTV